MGYSYRNGGDIKDFWPDDTEDCIYLQADASMNYIMETIVDKWGQLSLDEIRIEAEYIHTSCLTYDQYDPSDYTNFLVIRRIAT